MSASAFAEYDPKHTMLALNMAIVSVQRILTTESRAVLEQEYENIINNIAQGNIENDPEMLALFVKLQGVISSRKLRAEDRKRLQNFYDTAEKRRITYALSGIRLAEAQAQAAHNQAAAIENETRAKVRASQGRISDIQRDINDITISQAVVAADWLGGLATSCVSMFMGDIFAPSRMFWNTLDAYRKRP